MNIGLMPATRPMPLRRPLFSSGLDIGQALKGLLSKPEIWQGADRLDLRSDMTGLTLRQDSENSC